jgi:hypothetical protein
MDVERGRRAVEPASRRQTEVGSEAARRLCSKTLALGLADALCRDAVYSCDGDELWWVTRSAGRLSVPHRFINIGSAGNVLALAEVWAEARQPRHRDALAAGARWLSSAEPAPGPRIPGLYAPGKPE